MSSVIHYNVKAASAGVSTAAASKSIHFDGYTLNVGELKKRIIYNENWWQSEADATFDLQISNSNSGEDFRDDALTVHRNVSVLVKRVPAASVAAARKLFITPGSLGCDWNKNTSTWIGRDTAAHPNMNPLDVSAEDGDIQALMHARGAFVGMEKRHNTGPFQQVHNRSALTRDSKPPPGYKCHRCKKDSHYIQCQSKNAHATTHARVGWVNPWSHILLASACSPFVCFLFLSSLSNE